MGTCSTVKICEGKAAGREDNGLWRARADAGGPRRIGRHAWRIVNSMLDGIQIKAMPGAGPLQYYVIPLSMAMFTIQALHYRSGRAGGWGRMKGTKLAFTRRDGVTYYLLSPTATGKIRLK
jgi:hypothetical protein